MTKVIAPLALLVAIALFAHSALAAKPSVSVCHMLPGEHDNWQTITVSPKSLNGHLNHGDMNGACNSYAESLCDDGNLCTADTFMPYTEQCMAAGERPPTNCDDGDPNTLDSCDAKTGCVNTPVALCGDNALNGHEEFDPSPGPFASAPVDTSSCRYDFSNVTQLYCSGTCTWGGARGCDQMDADLFCKLKTDNPNSTATSFTTGSAMAEPGFACPLMSHPAAKVLGASFRGVTPTSGPVQYQDSSIRANHGSGSVVHSVVCTDP